MTQLVLIFIVSICFSDCPQTKPDFEITHTILSIDYVPVSEKLIEYDFPGGKVRYMMDIPDGYEITLWNQKRHTVEKYIFKDKYNMRMCRHLDDNMEIMLDGYRYWPYLRIRAKKLRT